MKKKENKESNIFEKKIEKMINIIIGIAFIILLGVCIIGYNYSIKNYDKIIMESEEKEEESNKYVDVAKKIFEIDEYPNVLCTTSTMQLAKKFMSNFTKQDESELEIEVLTKRVALEKLIKGESDLILTTELSTEEMKEAKEKGVELKSYKIANEGLIFITNTRNGVNNITLKQIKKIYTGEEKNWKNLEGNNQEIIACQRRKKSEIQQGMLFLVMDGLKTMKNDEKNNIADISTLINSIADYESNPGAIGYLYYKDYLYDNENIKLLCVNGVLPTYENIKNETYPIKTGYYVTIRETEEKNENIEKLTDAITSKRGKKLIEDAGYIASK